MWTLDTLVSQLHRMLHQVTSLTTLRADGIQMFDFVSTDMKYAYANSMKHAENCRDESLTEAARTCDFDSLEKVSWL